VGRPVSVSTGGREAVTGLDERIENATRCYERAVFEGDAAALAEADRDLDAVEADLALARGRIIHTRYLHQLDTASGQAAEDPDELALFERAAALYRALGDVAGEAEAQFWVGCFYQVVRRDNDMAAPALDRSLDLAEQAGQKMTMSEAQRHLGIAAHAAGQLDLARERLEQSTRLRRELGLTAGVASNLIGLAYIAAGQGRRDDALTILAEAGDLATASGARRILGSVAEAQSAIGG
jgi:tetratricopeptide (TPR) repeat protein